MPGTNLNPEKITHPFQLMAAWFAMLILLVSALLTAAVRIERPTWAPGFLVVSSVVLSTVVMVAVFLMLTKFRPHLQDAKEYAVWLRDERKFKGTSLRALKIREVMSLVQETDPETDSPDQVDYSENREDKFQIEVADAEGADKVLGALRRKGFQAHIYESGLHGSGTRSQHAAVWIGYKVSPSIVVPAMKAAVKVWTQLKYLHISSDSKSEPPEYIHDEVFIGGATSTAVEYGLKPWKRAEIEALSESMTESELHQLVREKYGDHEG